MILFIIVGCHKNDDTSFDDDVVINDEPETEEKTNQDITIDIWDIDPIYEFDDIDTWMTTRKSYPDMATSGKGTNSFNGLNSFAVTFNREDFYNSNKQYPFVIESYQKGGAIIYKNNYAGIINPKGEVTLEPTHAFNTHQVQGLRFDDSLINYDYSIEYIGQGGLAGGTGGLASLFLNDKGETFILKSSGDITFDKVADKQVFDFFDFAVINNYANENNHVLINTYASYYDHQHFYPFIQINDNLITGYIELNKDGYKLLNIPNNYQVIDFSNDIMTFGKANKDINSIWKYDSSQSYYCFEIECGNYDYSDITYVNTDGNVIASGFDFGYGFYEEYAAVCKNNKWGYIDKQGRLVVDYIFDKTTPICDGKAWVIYNGKTGKLNIKDMLDNNVPFNDETLNFNN